MSFLLKDIRSYILSHLQPRLPAKWSIAASSSLIFIFLLAAGSHVQAENSGIPLEKPHLQDAAAGKTIFEEKCAGCHSIGGGKIVGPDLQDITKQRDLQWIKDFILDPAAMIASDADAEKLYHEYNDFTMPNLGLTTEQVDQVVAYLSNPDTSSAPPLPSGPANNGDPTVGHILFTGEKALANGGPSCISCHAVSGTGALGGGGLGPDLTQVFQRFGEAGLASALNTLPFPTMMGPFQNHTLTEEDQAHLLAFFKAANQNQSPVAVVTPGAISNHVLIIFSFGTALALVMFVILWVLWLPLKKRYHKPLPVRKV